MLQKKINYSDVKADPSHKLFYFILKTLKCLGTGKKKKVLKQKDSNGGKGGRNAEPDQMYVNHQQIVIQKVSFSHTDCKYKVFIVLQQGL